MARLILNQVKKDHIELGKEYLVMLRDDEGPYFCIAVSVMDNGEYFWEIEDEDDDEVGLYHFTDIMAAFETPENGIIEDGEFDMLDRDEIIEDGFGSAWSAWCPKCKQKTMAVVRPGDARCTECE